MEATYMSISRLIDKTAVLYILNGILLSPKKNALELVLMRWMKLESEVSQKKKKKKTPIQDTNAYIWYLEGW